MPIIVKDFTWRQTDDSLIICVPLRGESMKNVDFITADVYLKASYPPYIFELFLMKPIKESESSCTKLDKELIFRLKKEEKGQWDVLEAELSKAEKMDIREKIQNINEMKYNQIAKEKSEKKAKLHRKVVEEQIKLEERARKEIEEIKNNERQKAGAEIMEFQKNADYTMQCTTLKSDTKGSSKEHSYNILKDSSKSGKKQITDEKNRQPAPRTASSIQIHFSARVFPTPSRESTAAEEDEWLRKQSQARRIAGYDDKDLSLDERNPTWLKDKGDSFFKVGNYVGAIAAYSHGIKMSKEMASLYSNRAAAHIALGNFFKALEDASTALDLMTPKTDSNAIARARCHAKRGAALWKLRRLDQGLVELCEARNLLKLYDKENNYLKSLEDDILKLQAEIDENFDDSESEI